MPTPVPVLLLEHWANAAPLLEPVWLVLRNAAVRPCCTKPTVMVELVIGIELEALIEIEAVTDPGVFPPPTMAEALARMLVMRKMRSKPALTGGLIGIPKNVT